MSTSSSMSHSSREQPLELSSDFFSKVAKFYRKIPTSQILLSIPNNVPMTNYLFIIRLEPEEVGNPTMKCTNIYLGKFLMNNTTPFMDTFNIFYGYNKATNKLKKIHPPTPRYFLRNSVDKPWVYVYIDYGVMVEYINKLDKSTPGNKRPAEEVPSPPKRTKSMSDVTKHVQFSSEPPQRMRAHSFDDSGTEVDTDDLSLTFDEDLFDDVDMDSSLDKKGGKRKTRKKKHSKKYKKNKKKKTRRRSK